MSDLLVSKTSQASQDGPGSFADMTDMFQASVNVGSADSVVLLIASFTLDQGGSADHVAECQFAIDDSLEGPSLLVFKDNIDKGCGQSIVWARTGLSGSHKFALQWRLTVGSPLLDTGRVRSFQVIEITDASLLVDITSTATDDASSSYSDLAAMASNVAPASADSILLLIANHQTNTGTDNTVAHSFEIDAVREGPEPIAFEDATDEACGSSWMWLKTGISSAIDWVVQWIEIQASIATGDFVRSFQVIEITDNANLLSAITSTAAHSLGGSYADVDDLVDTVDVEGTDSILLFGACFPGGPSADDTGVFRFFEGGTGEGPEVYCFQDDAGNHEGCGHSIYWAATGKSAGSHTFSLRGQNVTGTYPMATGFRRSITILELTAAVTQVDKDAIDTVGLEIDETVTDLEAQASVVDTEGLAIDEQAAKLEALIESQEAIDLALEEAAALEARASRQDILDLALIEQAEVQVPIEAQDDIDLAIDEQAEVAAGLTAEDNLDLAIVEGPAEVAAGLAAQDTLGLAIDEGPTDLLAAADPVDTTGLTADEVADLLAASSRLDGLDLALVEISQVVAALDAFDSLDLAIDEATGQIVVSIAAADDLDLALAELAELLALLGVSDTIDLVLDDAAAVLNLLARSDTLSITIDDAGEVAVQITAADQLDLAIVEGPGQVVVGVAASDTLGLAIAEAAEVLAFLQRADTLNLALVEGVPVLLASVAAEDTLGLEIVDQATVQVPIETSDLLALAIDEVSQVIVALTANDILSLSVDEISTLAGFLNRSDIAGLELGEDAQLLAFLDRIDTLELTIDEVSNLLNALAVADSLGLAIGEVAQVLNAVAALDTLGLAIAEAPADVFKQTAFQGVIVQPFTLVVCREAAFTLEVVREVNFTLQIEGSGEQIP